MATTTTTTTFVSSFAKIYSDDNEHCQDHDFEWRTKYFREMATTGIKICLYGCENTHEMLKQLENEFPENVKLMSLKWENTKTYNFYSNFFDDKTMLPGIICTKKDTAEYMTLTNSKLDFMNDAITHNPFNSTTFAWVDFSLFYIFSDKVACSQKIKHFSTIDLPNKSVVYIPGWANEKQHIDDLLKKSVWRFCGGFFIGSSHAIQKFYNDYLEEMPKFMKKHKKIVWESNLWAYMEHNKNSNIVWNYCMFNDTLLNIF